MFIKNTPDFGWEMDTVKGCRERGKRLLTMIHQEIPVMLLFLMPDGKAESVKRVFDYLEEGLEQSVSNVFFLTFLRTMDQSSREWMIWS